ncbi:hypothetical protein AMS68_003560 [Peltaster fructicola]|uniref:Uncharacterized protein n=1 Tax=Peltaster fructicola TaxID=286661 RepID=A0A6H0XTJ5_9PEZI|nr:hypothetical protein AMS68_003560 [Peltaster fructicola]
MVVFKDDIMADHCLKQSGLEFTIGKDSDHTIDNFTDDSFEARIAPLLSDSPPHKLKTSPDGLPTPPPRKVFVPHQQHSEEPTGSRVFKLVVNRALTDLRTDIDMGWFHGFFMPDYRRTPNEDLASRVPLRPMANIDWRHDKRPGREVKAQRAQDEGGPNRWIPLRELHNEYLKHGPTKQREGMEEAP